MPNKLRFRALYNIDDGRISRKAHLRFKTVRKVFLLRVCASDQNLVANFDGFKYLFKLIFFFIQNRINFRENRPECFMF
jgi:hypothetical protein